MSFALPHGEEAQCESFANESIIEERKNQHTKVRRPIMI